MNITKLLTDRLSAVNPGWVEWGKLITLVNSLSFEQVESEYLGRFYTSSRPLTFADPAGGRTWPSWLPTYVQALVGMKADDWEMAGGYADSFDNELAVKGAVFSP